MTTAANWLELVPSFDVRNYTRLHRATDIGLNGVFGLDVGVTSNAIRCIGGSQFNIGFDFVHASATELQFLFERARSEAGPWRYAPAWQLASTGVVTLKDQIYRLEVTGDVGHSINFPINEAWMRFTVVGAAAHPTNDQVTCDVLIKAGV